MPYCGPIKSGSYFITQDTMKAKIHQYHDYYALNPNVVNEATPLMHQVLFLIAAVLIIMLLVPLIAHFITEAVSVNGPDVPFIETSNDVAPVY